MKTKTLLLGAVASIALAGTAEAHGWYIGVETGGNWVEDVDAVGTVLGAPITGSSSLDSGWALIGTVGHSLGGNWRIEGELGYRSNETDTGGYVEVTELSFMLNVLHDIALSPSLDLSLGAGIGYDETTFDFGGLAEESDGDFAYQGIVGLNWAVGSMTDLTFTYRYFTVGGPEISLGAGVATAAFDDITKHTLSVGLRFRMGGGGE